MITENRYNDRLIGKTLTVWSLRTPFSLDPLDYDALAHHICFTSVFSPLVSDYRQGSIQGIVAERWTVNSEYSEWNFFIRKGMFYTNGDSITSKSVAFSLNRIAIKMLLQGSKSGIFEFIIKDSSELKYSKLISGITYDEEKVTLRFIMPIPDLLRKISFGIYSIINFKDFNEITGDPKEKNQISQSGPYRVVKWDSSSVKLALRDDYPIDLKLDNPIYNAEIKFGIPPTGDEDLIVDFDDSLITDDNYSFFGPVKSAIRYLECGGYNRKNSFCSNELNRAILKKMFYEEIQKIKPNVVKSFFPLAIKGVQELSTFPALEKTEIDTNKYKYINLSSIVISLKSQSNRNKLTWTEAVEAAVRNVSQNLNVKLNVYKPGEGDEEKLDLKFKMTAILVDAPRHDIKFMFNSKQGIRLPDVTGEILNEIEKNDFEIQNINKKIWEQNVVWPLGHMALGVWVKNNKLDLSKYNFILPPLDLQWLSYK